MQAMRSEPEFHLTTGVCEGVQVVAVSGEVDLATSPVLKDALMPWVEAWHRLVVVDLSHVTFLDSSGMSVLTVFHKRFLQCGGELRVVVTEPGVKRVLEIAGLDAVLLLYDSVIDAVRSVDHLAQADPKRPTAVRPRGSDFHRG